MIVREPNLNNVMDQTALYVSNHRGSYGCVWGFLRFLEIFVCCVCSSGGFVGTIDCCCLKASLVFILLLFRLWVYARFVRVYIVGAFGLLNWLDLCFRVLSCLITSCVG